MTNQVRVLAASLLVVVATAACNDPLDVKNTTNPDVERVYALPATIEQAIGTGYQQCRNSVQNAQLMQQLETMALENYSQLNNFFMGPRGGIPRGPIQNNRSASSVFDPFTQLSRQARQLTNALAALDKLVKGGGTTGTPATDLRDRAFGFFTAACNLGYLGLTYDSAGIVSPDMPTDEIPDLSPYTQVIAASIAFLDSAVVYGNSAAAASAFPTLPAWMSGTTLTQAQFIQLVRTFRAKLRAEVARTPAERAAVDWAKVIDDAENGIKADILVTVSGASGWVVGFEGQQMHVDATWSQLTMMLFGFADVSGGFADFVSKPLTERGYFLVVTPDKRWPQGTTRLAQQTASPNPGSYLSLPYVENRKGSDSQGDPWGSSYYNYFRYKYINLNSNVGQFPEFLKSDTDLLAAEGYIRTGKFAEAAAKIDITRVGRGGLPPLAGAVTSATQPVPGGASCVPQVPQPPSFNTVACGNLMEALKYEKRLESAFNSFGGWFFDARGWGDLVVNTPLHFPVPFQELDARQHPFYDVGGQGGIFAAARGTYGF